MIDCEQFLLQYYEMSYGLNVEMHKQVSCLIVNCSYEPGYGNASLSAYICMYCVLYKQPTNQCSFHN